MKNFHLTKSPDGWQVKQEKTDKPLLTAETKEKMLDAWRAYADKHATLQDPYSLKIHGLDGKIQEERTYPKAADPKGSKG